MIRIKYFILFVFLFSCKNQYNSLYNFDPRSIDANEISLSDIADEISYIPLDNSFPIGMVFNYEILNNSIYLSAKEVGILAFRRDGKFIRQIGSIGRGPGEYTYYMDFTFDDEKGTVYVEDSGNKIKVYSKAGEFMRSFSLQEYGEIIDAINFNDSRIFVSYILRTYESKYDYTIHDTLGQLIKKKDRTLPPFTTNWILNGGTYRFDYKLFFWNSFNDTIYSILPDLTSKASFIMSPGDHRFPRLKFYSFEEKLKYLMIYYILETKRFIILKYFFNKPVLALIEKKDRKSFIVYLESDGSNGIINNLDGGLSFLPENYFMENGREYLVELIFPYHLKSHIESLDFKNSSPKYHNKKIELEKLANSIKETDNPVLMLVRLK